MTENCAKCSKYVGATAKKCKSCGHPRTSSANGPQDQVITTEADRKLLSMITTAVKEDVNESMQTVKSQYAELMQRFDELQQRYESLRLENVDLPD